MLPGPEGTFVRLNGTIALLDLAVGYIVCYLAQQAKPGLLKKAGYIIGVSIIVISSLLVIGKVISIAKRCATNCPIMSAIKAPGTCANMSAPTK
jgi:uncharacterized membrane protein (Fun14 family)